MKVLYVGSESGTSGHRARGFARMGHEVLLLDPRQMLPPSRLVDRLEWRVHPAPLAALVRTRLLRALGDRRVDLTFVDGGSLVSARLVQDLKTRSTRVVNFNHDDPFGSRDRVRFSIYRTAVPFYDLIVVVRWENVDEAKALGAKRVLRRFMVADEVAHAPRAITPEIERQWASEVAFVGTWMPERGPFLARLLQLGVPLSIYGARWEKAPEWRILRIARRTQHLDGEQYCYAIQCAKICLGLLSVGNRDLHTTRSMEVPALGALLCAQRTREHEQLYVEGEEAVFWDDANECANVCHTLLADTERSLQIARRGHARCLANGHFTTRLLSDIAHEAFR